MTGVATPVQPDSTTQTGSTYKGAIDGGFAVAKRLAWAFAPHEQSSPNMTVRVDAGMVLIGTTLTAVAAQNTGTITAPVTNPRIDRVVIDQATGTVSVITGTPAGSPVAPAITAGKLPVAQVLLQTSSTTITNSMITDERAPGVQISVDGWGGQIKFPATQNASADANTLDDYEKGAWTPSIGGTATYTAQTGTYTKIGRLVYVNCVLQINAIGTGSVNSITGLPFAPAAQGSLAVGIFTGAANNLVSLFARINTSSSISMLAATVAGSSAGSANFFASGTLVILSGSYEV